MTTPDPASRSLDPRGERSATMGIRLSATGLVVHGEGRLHDLARFLDRVLRGVGQVMFQDNGYTGLLFLVGVGYSSLPLAGAVLVGTATGTLAAEALGADRALAASGIFGFNGGLVGIALLMFLQPGALTWACVVLAAVCSTILLAAMLAALDVWRIPPLTAPFVLTTLCFLLAAARLGRVEPAALLPPAALPGPAAVEGVVTISTLAVGIFTGIGQVFLQGDVVTGILFATGLLVASRVACAAALAGSLVGALVAWGMGAAEPAIRAGLWGFNGVLVAIALMGVFLAPTRRVLGYALLATVATPFVTAAAGAALAPLGLPALTLPFVLVTWVFLLASRGFPRLHAGGPP